LSNVEKFAFWKTHINHLLLLLKETQAEDFIFQVSSIFLFSSMTFAGCPSVGLFAS